MTVETSVSCSYKLSAAVTTTASQAEALLAILEWWGELFEAKKAELLPCNEANEWGDDDDDWNDGWETLQDLEQYVVSAHPLHACWLQQIHCFVHAWKRSSTYR